MIHNHPLLFILLNFTILQIEVLNIIFDTEKMKIQLKMVLTLWLLVAMVASQGLINRVRIEDKAEGTG